tara:strand:- start:2306 stop:3826 length:1521 start_codon:yes stop_codon:yes gene_type:complete
MSVKNIVTNVAALKAKYGTNYPIIQAALTPLIAHDRANNIVTTVYDVSDPVQMAWVKAPVVKNPADAMQFKQCFDEIIANTNPHASMILGGPDIVPHVPVVNPAADDDSIVPSDLPYACAGRYSTSAFNFTAPSRILTRLPDIAGGTDANYLATLLRTPVSYRQVKASSYTDTYFSPGVADWQAELQGTLAVVFGNYSDLYLSPPNGPNWTSAQYQQQFHYINCHGSSNDPSFYGQSGASYPKAMDSPLVNGRLTNGMGSIAACCYSAQLYNPYAGGARTPPLPMSNTYLQSNAIFYMGSSVICYGGSPPYNQPKNANLAASAYAARIFAGDTIGQAMLSTWQTISASYTATGSLLALKTLVEFMAFGDVTTAPIDVTLPGREKLEFDRTRNDALRRAQFEAIADQLAIQPGQYDAVAMSDVGDDMLARIEGLVEADGARSVAIAHREWVPAERSRSRPEGLVPEARRLHLVRARSREESIFEFDLLYEIFEIDGEIVSVDIYPRR